MAQCTNGWRSLLSLPFLYSLCMDLLGGSKAIQTFVDTHLKPYPGIRILDLGCGPATILNFLPTSIKYVGVDISRAYIEVAKAKYASRGTYYCLSLDDLNACDFVDFDLVLGMGVLHHLDDNQVKRFFSTAYQAVRKNGRCITIDPCRMASQHWLARSLINLDRGQNVRTIEVYRTHAEDAFRMVSQFISHDLLRIPYTHLVMSCQKNDG